MSTYADRGNGFYELNIDGNHIYYYSVGDYIECTRCMHCFHLTEHARRNLASTINNLKNKDTHDDFKPIILPEITQSRICCTITRGLPALLDKCNVSSRAKSEFMRKMNALINTIPRHEDHKVENHLVMRIEKLEHENELLRKRIDLLYSKLDIDEKVEEVMDKYTLVTSRIIINAKTIDDSAICSIDICEDVGQFTDIDALEVNLKPECIFNNTYTCSLNHIDLALEHLEILGIISNRNNSGFTIPNANQVKIKAAMELFKTTLIAKINT